MNFLNLYNEVFDQDGEIMVCGRDKCKNLIYQADKLEPQKSHGDLNTGYMKVQAIKNLKERYCYAKDHFDEIYSQVFGANGNVLACGREKCKMLIEACNMLEPGVKHGNENEGFMDVETIKNYKANRSNNISA